MIETKAMTEEYSYTIRRDGNAWFATRSDFENLMESISGFGDTPVEALRKLILAELEEASTK